MLHKGNESCRTINSLETNAMRFANRLTEIALGARAFAWIEAFGRPRSDDAGAKR
jgi:hypothetical protein